MTGLSCSASETDGGTTVTPNLGTRTVSFDLKADDTVECTYTNTLQRGALAIVKNSTKGGAVSTAGAVFSYNGTNVTDNGTGDANPAIGRVCVSGLATGNYTVNEESPPPGYGDAPGSQDGQTVRRQRHELRPQPAGGQAPRRRSPTRRSRTSRSGFRDGGSGETALTWRRHLL